MAETKPPKVFISYAWEDDVKTWVLDLATRLRQDGVEAILDQWAVVPGDQLTQFMEKAVRESDFVVFICTPTYKRKSDRRKGGVGYEGGIITGEVFAKNNHRKFIPVLRKGKWKSAAPSWAVAKLFIDLRGDPYSDVNYQQLLNTFLGKLPSAPPVRDDTLPISVVHKDIGSTDSETAERKITEKSAREKAEIEIAEKVVREKLVRVIAKNVARDKAEHETAEKAAREKTEKESAEKARLEAEELTRQNLAKEKAAKDKLERQIADLKSMAQNEISASGFDQIKFEINILLSSEYAEAFKSDLVDLQILVEVKQLELYKAEILQAEKDDDIFLCEKLINKVLVGRRKLSSMVLRTPEVEDIFNQIREINERINLYEKVRHLLDSRDFLSAIEILEDVFKKFTRNKMLPGVEFQAILSYARVYIRQEIVSKKKKDDFENAIGLANKFSVFSDEDKKYYEDLLLEQSNELKSLLKRFDVSFEDDNLNAAENSLIRAVKIAGKSQSPDLVKSQRMLRARKFKLQFNGIVKVFGYLVFSCIIVIALFFLSGLFRLDPIIAPIPTFTSTHAFVFVTPTRTNIPSSTPIEKLTATATPLPTEITDTKGVTMRLVPAGEFTMGSENGDDDEKPVHQVYLDAFYMDIYEVTNAAYKACVDAGDCTPPQQTNSYTRSNYYGNLEFDDYPVIYVDWNQANAYCEWRGGSLPTEAQWEKAARGTDGRTYPWGESIPCNRANYSGCLEDTNKVGSYINGVSPYGIYDLAGNVWEWVNDRYDESYYKSSPSSNPLGSNSGLYRVLRGGSWQLSYDGKVRSSNRHHSYVNYGGDITGFRCAVGAP